MKISKILAGMSALAIAAATAIPAFAEKTFVNETNLDYVTADGNMLKISLGESPYDPATVSAVKVTFTVDDSQGGFGGGFMLNSKKSGWDQKEPDWVWANPGEESEDPRGFYAEGSDGNYTVTFDFGVLGEEYWGTPSDEGYYAEICCQEWWGADMTVTGVEITGDEKTADESSAADVESSAADTESSKADESSNSEASSTADSSSKAATTNNNNTKNTTTGTTATSSAAASDNTNQATGATAGLALAGLALAGAVAVVSKRK